MKKKKWMGTLPTHCEVGKEQLTDRFVDGATRGGPWAIMCPKCHVRYGSGLGTGLGQMYDAKTGDLIAGGDK